MPWPSRRNRVGPKSGTFDFLGFTHIGKRSRKGNFTIHVRTMRKRLRRSLKAVTGRGAGSIGMILSRSSKRRSTGNFGALPVLWPVDEFQESIGILRSRPQDLAEVAQPKESWKSPELQARVGYSQICKTLRNSVPSGFAVTRQLRSRTSTPQVNVVLRVTAPAQVEVTVCRGTLQRRRPIRADHMRFVCQTETELFGAGRKRTTRSLLLHKRGPTAR
jgi:hypothetical protein